MAQLLDPKAGEQLRAVQLQARQEQARRKIVKWTLVIFWLLVFEGALRKWVVPPEASRPLFFIRDPFLLYLYFIALRSGLWPRFRGVFMVATVFAMLTLVVIFIQIVTSQGHGRLLLAGYGWRNYFLYMPLAFIMAQQFRREDVERFIKHVLMLLIPVAVLVAMQFASPASSPLNHGFVDGETIHFQAFRGAAGRIRPNSFFTSVAGHQQLVASSIAMLLALWLVGRRERSVSTILLYLATGAAVTCLALSVSRGLFIHGGLIMLSSVVAGLVLRRPGIAIKAWLLPVVLIVGGVLLYPIIFPEGYEAFTTRWEQADATESRKWEYGVFSRAWLGFVLFIHLIADAPLFGYGMGLGGNASRFVEGVALPVLAEDEWSRNIVDLGSLFGVVFIVFRIAFVGWLGVKAVAATRRIAHPLPVLLFGYVGIMLLNGQVTGHGSINGFAWIIGGLLMASCNWGKDQRNTPIRKTGLLK